MISSILGFGLSSAVHGWADGSTESERIEMGSSHVEVLAFPLIEWEGSFFSYAAQEARDKTQETKRGMEGMGEDGYPLPKCGVISDTVLNVSNHRYL